MFGSKAFSRLSLISTFYWISTAKDSNQESHRLTSKCQKKAPPCRETSCSNVFLNHRTNLKTFGNEHLFDGMEILTLPFGVDETVFAARGSYASSGGSNLTSQLFVRLNDFD